MSNVDLLRDNGTLRDDDSSEWKIMNVKVGRTK